MPAVKVSGSRDGRTWRELSAAPEETAGEDIKDTTLRLSGKHHYVKLDFAARKGGKVFEFCEVDIWGAK